MNNLFIYIEIRLFLVLIKHNLEKKLGIKIGMFSKLKSDF